MCVRAGLRKDVLVMLLDGHIDTHRQAAADLPPNSPRNCRDVGAMKIPAHTYRFLFFLAGSTWAIIFAADFGDNFDVMTQGETIRQN